MLLLPEHNPVVVAKQAASLDRLSDGRLTLGVGVGWSREEFAALGVPFERRAARTVEYVAAMRTLWREDVASFEGTFSRFAGIRVNPKPVRDRQIPVVVGGNSDLALRRVAAWGDGWYGFNLDGMAAVRDRVANLDRLCAESGRDRAQLRLSVALRDPKVGDIGALAELGIDRRGATSCCRRRRRAPPSPGLTGRIHICWAAHCPNPAAARPRATLTKMLPSAARVWRSSPRRWVSSIQVENVV